MKLVILDAYAENPGDLSWDWLKNVVEEYEIYDITPPEKVIERSINADILVTNKTVLTADILSQLPKLRYISTLATGYNVIDTAYAREKGITVSNIPAYSTDGVAQLVFALILEIVNHVALHNKSVKEGDWCKSEHFCYWKAPIAELAHKTLGIVGFGKIGSAVAQIANAFGMNVIASTNHPAPFGNVEFFSKDEVAKRSDFLSLHCPLTPETEGMINAEFLAKMKPSAILINTSRGQVINESDLADALNNGIIAGASLDVMTVEPPKADNPLLGIRNCRITPHIAWAGFETRARLMEICKNNVKAFIDGNPQNVVY